MWRTTLLPSAVALLLSSPAAPQCLSEQAKLLGNPGAPFDNFGHSVSVSGDTAVVGAPTTDDAGVESGAAYVFVRSGASWVQEARLLSSDPEDFEHFGYAVAVHGDTILIGAPHGPVAPTNLGSVQVFVRSGSSWMQQATLSATDVGPGDHFGNSVSLFEDTAVIGSPLDRNAGIPTGSAYVFVRNGATWTRQAKLFASDGEFAESFGASVSISGDSVAVGANYDDDAGSLAGSAYVFVRSGASWSLQEKLTASNASISDQFGTSVSIDGDSMLIGAPHRDAAPLQQFGAAYVFTRSGTSWGQERMLLPNDMANGSYYFGQGVSLSRGTAVVGATGSGSTGAAYVFEGSGTAWSQQARLTTGDRRSLAFGSAVSISASTVMVGTPLGFDATGQPTGAAYVFTPPVASGSAYCTCPIGPCGNSETDAGCANSTGAGAQLTAQGSSSPDGVNLLVSDGPPGELAIFVQADTALMLPFGDGFRCLGGSLVRMSAAPVSIEPDGSAEFGPCFGGPTISSITGVIPGSGDVKRYQLWYRDPGGPCGSGFNLSNGYEIVW